MGNSHGYGLQPLAHEWMPNQNHGDNIVKRCTCGHVVTVKRAPGWTSKQASGCNRHIASVQGELPEGYRIKSQ